MVQKYRMFTILKVIRKQPSRGAPTKRCSKNMQQIYIRTPMPKCEITLRHGCSPVNLLVIWLSTVLWTTFRQTLFSFLYPALKPRIRNDAEIAALSKNFVMVNCQDDEEPMEDQFDIDGAYIPRIYFLGKKKRSRIKESLTFHQVKYPT